MVSGGPAHARPYACTPAVRVKIQLTVLAGTTNMTQDVVPMCNVYSFLLRTVGVGAPSMSRTSTTCTSRPNLDHARAPRDHCQLDFDRDGGGAGIWPSVCRPTRHHDGHPVAIAHWFSTRMVGADMFPDVCCHVRGGTWHTLRVPRTWRTWRGWSTRHTWRTWSTWPIWRTRRAWHAWAPGAPGPPGARGAPRPSVAHMGSVLVPSSCPSKDGR